MRHRNSRRFKFDLSLKPETRHGILTIVILALAVLLLLSLFDLAGGFGVRLDQISSHIFGWDKIVLPFFLIAIGYHLLSPERLPLRFTNYLGFLLFFLALNPFIHLIAFGSGTPGPDALARAGGKLGMLLTGPLTDLMGLFGAGAVFAAVFLTSLLLIFNTSLRRLMSIVGGVGWLFKKVGQGLLAPFHWLAARANERREQAVREAFSAESARADGEEDMEFFEAEQTEVAVPEAEATPAAVPVKRRVRRRLRVEIPIELLSKRDQRPTSGDIEHNQLVIQRTLENFSIPVEMGDVAVGPTVTQFTLKPSEGVKLSKITALHNDLALALAAHPIRIEAPIPGKSLVGVEVPNQSVATVGVREILEAREWRERPNNLHFVLGRDVAGKPWVTDLARMPHVLVAGATGSGKSVCLNALLMSLLFSNGPDDVKFILVDPKRVELPVYNGIPHLIAPVITEVDKTINALKWALREMDRRFDVLSSFKARDLASYNQQAEEKMPYIVIVVDELADLMMSAMAEVEGAVVRLAQMSRAVGIHLVLATQRPSVDVITGLIKANIPARIAFAVASSGDSRTILDHVGAEKLLGRGDMLFSSSEMSSPRRLQGAFLSDDEIKRVVEFLKSKYEPAEYDESVLERSTAGVTLVGGGGSYEDIDSDPLMPQAKEEILRAGKGSASLLQRRLKVGYARAARLLDILEQEGFIGPADGAKPREVLQAEFTNQMDPIPYSNTSSNNFSPVELPDEEGEPQAIEETD